MAKKQLFDEDVKEEDKDVEAISESDDEVAEYENGGDNYESDEVMESIVRQAVIESVKNLKKAGKFKLKKKKEDEDDPETEAVTESAKRMAFQSTIFEAAKIADYSEMRMREKAMIIVNAWLEAGDFSWDAFYAMCVQDADFDSSGEVDTPEEKLYYNELIIAAGDALTSLGIDSSLVQKFIDKEDNTAGEEVGNQLSETMGNEDLEPGDVINKYAVSGIISESTNIPVLESQVKVAHHGRFEMRQKKIKHPKKPRSGKQRAAWHKTQMLAQKAPAKKNRAKSMALRNR